MPDKGYGSAALQDSVMGDGFDMPDDALDDLFADCDDDDFDPLIVDDSIIDQEDMDDDNPYDTIDYPTVREMPQHMQRDAVYTPEVQGSAEAAILALFDHNPSRRPVLLAIIDMCREGCVSSQITEQVNELQEDNRSVYAPMTLCRMLERAGALLFVEPEIATEAEDIDQNVEYLEINETVDPIWVATDAGLAIYEQSTQGVEFRKIVLDHDAKYLEVYQAILSLMAQGPTERIAIEQLVDTFEITKSPRRFGGHFIDMLEKTDAIIWKSNAWNLTQLGQEMYHELVVGNTDDVDDDAAGVAAGETAGAAGAEA